METKQSENEILEKRVLVLMPTGRDASLVCDSLEKADIAAQSCASAEDLEKKVSGGGGAVLIAEEALQNGTLEHLIESLNSQPIWSDVPVVLFAANARSAEKLSATVGTRLNATIVERPIRTTMLLSAVRGALRAREKQYQTRDLLNRLEESDKQKDLFLATLSHELRTPLNSIIGWIHLLRKNSENINSAHALNVIERNANAQAEMISDILFVSRVITGKLTLKIEAVDLIQVVEAAIDTLRPAIEAKEIRLNTSFDPDVDVIEGDADRLQQVFWNLLSNAVKFTPNRGQIDVSVKRDGKNIKIEVRDSGQGIKPEFLPFVFERFRQADSSYTRQVGGLGLGLAIVRHLVELHGGDVSVKSRGENLGATFTVSLPVTAKNQQETPPENAEIEASEISEDEKLFDGVRILLVEDDDDSREMLRVMFSQYGTKVTDFATAAEAFDEIKKNQTDIIISDVGLPKEDGYQLIGRIRKLAPEQGGQTPAIALTGYANLQDRIHALDAGFQEHLAKPVDLDVLIEIVKNMIVQNNLGK